MSSSTLLSTFCDRCKVISFDDSQMEGHAVQGDDGHEYLGLADGPLRQYLDTGYVLDDIYPSLPLLSKSAVAGCKFCEFLKVTAIAGGNNLSPAASAHINACLQRNLVDVSKGVRVRIHISYIWNVRKLSDAGRTKGLSALKIAFVFETRNSNGRWNHHRVRLVFSIESAPSVCSKWLRLSTKEPGCALSPATVSWIQDKLNSSPYQLSVEMQYSDRFIPTRLILTDCEPPPRLIETSRDLTRGDDKPVIQYAALTYCWGSPDEARLQLKTERSSLRARLAAIQEHEMTPVLQDAIKTCRSLSISYLWMDALCIVQDDPLDWEKESASVGKIYSNAYLTICALASDSCAQSFLDRKPPSIEIPFQSKVKPEIHGSYGLRFLDVDPNDMVIFNELNGDIQRSKWRTRGWTFQEMLMSTRVLAFGNAGIHLLGINEHQTRGEPPSPGPFHFRIFSLPDTSEACYVLSFSYVRWFSEVAAVYSKRTLTCPHDRFPALSGIAQYFGEKLKDEYVAGLWKCELYRGLFWSCSRNSIQTLGALLDELSDTSRYVAPSWSWACRQGFVVYNAMIFNGYCPLFGDYRSEYRSMKTDTIYKGADRFGQIKEASLQIVTKTCPLPSSIHPEDIPLRDPYIGDPKTPFARCQVTWRLDVSTEPARDLTMLLLGSAVVVESDNMVSSYTPEVSLEDLEDLEDSRWIYGLIIHPAPGTNKFFRVGTFYSPPYYRWGTRLFKDCQEKTVVLI